MVEHMKEYLIEKVVSDVEHIYTEDIFGEIQTGMKFTFEDGTTIKITIEIDDELNNRANLDWHIKHPVLVDQSQAYGTDCPRRGCE